MPLYSKTFSEVITFARGTGKTRINAVGAIVGVDFSTTSNTITTGFKTFTLAAAANVDRDWSISSSVITVDQGGAGSMTGVVVSYTPSTQALVINVASVTGSGASTNWRIGSLEMTRDAVTGAVSSEPAATNLLLNSDTLTTQAVVVTIGRVYALSFWGTGSVTLSGAATGTFTGNGEFPAMRQSTTFTATAASLILTVTGSVRMGQLELNAPTSYIPTTTTQVTRNADSFALTTSVINSIRQGQGSLVIEAESADVGPAQKRAIRLSGPTGDIRLAKQGVGSFSGFLKMATNGVVDVYAVNNTVNNVLRYNGVDAVVGSNTVASATTGVAHNGTDTFLTVGAQGALVTTPDGTNYTNRTIEANQSITSGTFGAGKFVVAANSGFRVSTDGLSWRRVSVPGQVQQQNDMTYNGTNTFVSVGNAGTAYTSPDGETWTLRSTGTTSNISGATFGAGLFVAAISATANNIRTSPDGITWTARATAVTNAQNDVSYNGTNLFVSVGNAGTIQSSPDAVTWTSRASGTANNLQGIHFAAGQWVAVGGAGTVITSPDGSTWTTRTSGTANELFEVNYVPFAGQALWVSVGNAGTIITSPDAITWTTRTSTTTSQLLGIMHNGQTAVATGGAGIITASTDGTTWTARTGNSAQLNGAAFGNGTFVVVGTTANGSGVIATVDPLTGAYTRRVSNLNGATVSQNFNNINFLNGLFIANINSGVQSYATSTDGSTWVVRGMAGTAFVNHDTAFMGGIYVIVGNLGRVATSTDGLNFTGVQSGATANSLLGIDAANGVFVAVGASGTIITSANGLTWTLRTSGTTQTLRTVNYNTGDRLWYAAGDNGVFLSSPDASTWQPVQDASIAAIDSNGLQANPQGALWATGVNRIGVSYAANAVRLALNGVLSTLDDSAIIPNISAGILGENFNGVLRKADIYNRPLTDTELTQATGVVL